MGQGRPCALVMMVLTVLVSSATACAVRWAVHSSCEPSGVSCSMSSTSCPAAWMKRPVYSTVPGSRADGGDRVEVTAGAGDDDGDSRTGQSDGGHGQVAAGGGNVLGDQDFGRLATGAGDSAESDGAGCGQVTQAFDGVVEAFLRGWFGGVGHEWSSGGWGR